MPAAMTTKSREYLYGNDPDRGRGAPGGRLACKAWNMRMLGYKGPAQPSPTLGDALNAGYRYPEVLLHEAAPCQATYG